MLLNRRLSLTLTACALFLCTTIASAAEGDWLNWRGPTEDGHTTESGIPVRWDEKSIVWKTALEGDGQSSPVIVGDRIFLTTALEKGKQRVVFCVNRTDGKI